MTERALPSQQITQEFPDVHAWLSGGTQGAKHRRGTARQRDSVVTSLARKFHAEAQRSQSIVLAPLCALRLGGYSSSIDAVERKMRYVVAPCICRTLANNFLEIFIQRVAKWPN
jgi:hypothetical protein